MIKSCLDVSVPLAHGVVTAEATAAAGAAVGGMVMVVAAKWPAVPAVAEASEAEAVEEAGPLPTKDHELTYIIQYKQTSPALPPTLHFADI